MNIDQYCTLNMSIVSCILWRRLRSKKCGEAGSWGRVVGKIQLVRNCSVGGWGIDYQGGRVTKGWHSGHFRFLLHGQMVEDIGQSYVIHRSIFNACLIIYRPNKNLVVIQHLIIGGLIWIHYSFDQYFIVNMLSALN